MDLPLVRLFWTGIAVAASLAVVTAASQESTSSRPSGPTAAAGLQAEAASLLKSAQAYRDQGDPVKALELADQAAQQAAVGRQDPTTAAAAWLMSADLLREMSRHREALERLEQWRAVLRARGSRRSEAKTVLRIAQIYRDLNQPVVALSVIDELLALAADQAPVVSEARRVKADIRRDLGQHHEALSEYTLLLEEAQKAGDRVAELVVLRPLTQVYRDQKRLAEARRTIERGVTLARAIRDRGAEARFLQQRAGVASQEANPDAAFRDYQEALACAREWGDRFCIADLLEELAGCQRDRKQIEAALQGYEEAIQARRELYDRDGEARVLFEMARFERDSQRYTEALRHMRQSLLLSEQSRASLGAYDAAKIRLVQTRMREHLAYVSLLLDYPLPVAAFKWSQKAKARALLDSLEDRPRALRQELTGAEIAEERRLQRELAAANRALVAAATERDGARRLRLKRAVAEAEARLARYVDTLYARYPRLADRRASRTITLDDVRTFLPPDTLLLEYVALDTPTHPDIQDRIVCFRIETGTGEPTLISGAQMPTCTEIRSLSRRFRKECAGGDLNFRETARELFQKLIGPFQAELAEKKRLVICPDGPLWGLPFQALLRRSEPEGKERFLFEDFEIVYAYSASTARAALTSKPYTSAEDAPPVTVFAGPASEPTFPRLPGALQEARAIKSLFPQARIVTGTVATEAEVRRSSAGNLHFATHGWFNDLSPLESGLVLAAERPPSPDDGLLTAREILGLDLRSDLVVLSGCSTAAGKQHQGEGLVGLGWALSAAGARAQMLTLWDVPDESTEQFMREFYRRLSTGTSRSAALREATRALAGSERYAHPRYWAPFVLFGDWR